MKNIAAVFLLAAVSGAQNSREPSSESHRGSMRQNRTVVFVCEHGAALSVVAAAYFNKFAAEEHLKIRAVARGTTPQKHLSVSAREGLKADGVIFEPKRPRAFSAHELRHAQRIVAFCPVPGRYSRMAPVETWNDVPAPSEDYARSRDAIVRHLKKLISELRAQEP
jgi:arsenate reductase (thioredoxin)